MEKLKITNIKSLYGNEIVQKVRRHEKLARSCGRFRSHVRFNLQCKHNKVIPKTLRIKFQTKCYKSQEIIRKAEFALLNIRLSDAIQKLSKIRKEMAELEDSIMKDLPEDVFQLMKDIDKRREQNDLEKASIRQKNKYIKLKGQTETIEPEDGTPDQVERQLRTENCDYAETNKPEEQKAEAQGLRRSTRLKTKINYKDLHEGRTAEPHEITIPVNPIEDKAENIPQQTAIDCPNNYKDKWVKNLSQRPLTDIERKVLSRGQGFSVTPKKIPIDDFIVATEDICKKLSSKSEAAALRGEIRSIIENEKQPVSNLPKNERTALENLRKDQSIVILPADKGKCLVIMDKEEYTNRMEEKLADTSTYKRLEKDPTQEIRKALYEKLKHLKDTEHIDNEIYHQIKPVKTQIPRLKGRPKIHKKNYPLREIVDSKDSVTKGVDKHLSKIFKPYAEENEYRIKNSQEFVELIKNKNIEDDEIMVSYDVVALYPSIPQDEAIQVIYDKLINDENLKEKTKMTPDEIIQLFKICVERTYFVFNKKLYGQVKGLAIGASSSGFVADIFMEKEERRALTTFANPPRLWCRFVDDTWAFMKRILFLLYFLNALGANAPSCC